MPNPVKLVETITQAGSTAAKTARVADNIVEVSYKGKKYAFPKGTTDDQMKLLLKREDEISTLQAERMKLPGGHKFAHIADMQRGKPETAMLNIQKYHSGGPISVLTEHVGDLTHRMTNLYHNEMEWGREYILDKTDKALGYLKNVDTWHKSNVESNARYFKRTTEEHTAQLDSLLGIYAQEHSKLPVYNEAQRMARDAAVAIGKKDWDTARDLLTKLNTLAKDKKKYVAEAGKGLD